MVAWSSSIYNANNHHLPYFKYLYRLQQLSSTPSDCKFRNTFSKYNFWFIFTFPYQHHSLIHYIFAIISFAFIAYKKENTMGTARYFIFFTLNNLILGVIFICIGSAMKFVDSKILNFLYSYPIYGLWPFIMVEIVIKCNVQPDREVNFWFTSFPIRSRYYPWLFFVMFSVILSILWYLLIGICI